jgi:DNA-directed RNA polymerase subunit RPC12/RpoP
MLLWKSCGKCGGDVSFDPERHGVEVFCLHCGSRKFFTAAEMRALSSRTPSVQIITDRRTA